MGDIIGPSEPKTSHNKADSSLSIEPKDAKGTGQVRRDMSRPHQNTPGNSAQVLFFASVFSVRRQVRSETAIHRSR
jgi:hypothetical protein